MDFNIGSIDGPIAVIITIILSLAGLITSTFVYFYIYYSFVRRKNKEGQKGVDVAKKVFDKDGHESVKIKSYLLTIKFWAFSKKTNTMKLRPWTYKRESLWTLTTAASESYLADVKAYKKNKHFTMFTLPLIIRIISIAVAATAVLVAIIAPYIINVNEDQYSGKNLILPYLMIGAAFWVIGSSISTLNRSAELRKNLVPIVSSIISESNARSLKRILWIKWLFALSSLILAITTLPALFTHVAEVVSRIGDVIS